MLETKRLLLRRHQTADFADGAAMWADPQVTRYIRENPFTPEETWTRLLRFIGHWALLGFGYWAAEHKQTGSFLGEVGFADYKRDLKPSLDGIRENRMGLCLATLTGRASRQKQWGAAIAWGDSQFEGRRTACIIAPGNAASVRIAVKWGYREFQDATYHGHPTLVYVRDRA